MQKKKERQIYYEEVAPTLVVTIQVLTAVLNDKKSHIIAIRNVTSLIENQFMR